MGTASSSATNQPPTPPRSAFQAGFPVVSIRAGKRYGSGILITESLGAARATKTDLVLTCAHFFKGDASTGYHVHGEEIAGKRFRRTVDSVRTINGTDLAVLRLHHPAPARNIPAVIPRKPGFLHSVTTIGFGGRVTTSLAKAGRFLTTLPITANKNLSTLVRPAGLVFNPNPAIRGDSGGPVISGGAVVGVQALILDPWGFNAKVATIALIDAARYAHLRAAVRALVAAKRQ